MVSRPIILRSEYGRLGNQIFQYAALRNLPGTLILAGFSALFSTFINVDAMATPKRLQKPLDRLSRLEGNAPRALSALLGLIDEDKESGELRYAPGKSIYLCRRDVFSQSASPGVLQHGLDLVIRPDHLTRAKEFLKAEQLVEDGYLVVHVRGGDYAYFPSSQHPAQLPLSWIFRQIDQLRTEAPNAPLVILGDDPALKNEVAWTTGGVQSHGKPAVDLALMEMSRGGILSASSFAWWGAAFAKRRSSQARFIAPEHWFGHRLGRWEPQSIVRSPHLEFWPVPTDG
jgi:hypothetical protein